MRASLSHNDPAAVGINDFYCLYDGHGESHFDVSIINGGGGIIVTNQSLSVSLASSQSVMDCAAGGQYRPAAEGLIGEWIAAERQPAFIGSQTMLLFFLLRYCPYRLSLHCAVFNVCGTGVSVISNGSAAS